MDKVTEVDFEKVRKWVTLMKQADDGFGPIQQAKKQAWEEAKPAAAFLINYYFKTVNPQADTGEKSEAFIGSRPYGTTVTERALIMLNNGWPFIDGHNGQPFINQYPTLLEEAIIHYKKSLADDLEEALTEKVVDMTGAQLLLILREFDRQRQQGHALAEPDLSGAKPSSKPRKLVNPHGLLAQADQQSQDDLKEAMNERPGSQSDSDVAA